MCFRESWFSNLSLPGVICQKALTTACCSFGETYGLAVAAGLFDVAENGMAALAWNAVSGVRKASASAWPLLAAAAGAALCAVVIGVAVGWRMYALLVPGMLPALVAFALLSGWRLMSFPKIADRFELQEAPGA